MKKMENIDLSLMDQKQKRYFSAVMVLHALISKGEPVGYQTAYRAYDTARVLSEVESEVESEIVSKALNKG